MARMNEGISRSLGHEGTTPNWSLVPITTNDQPAPPNSHAEPHWAPSGPGWFDSSWLLRQGLEVTELCSVVVNDGVLRALQMQSPPNENALHAPA